MIKILLLFFAFQYTLCAEDRNDTLQSDQMKKIELAQAEKSFLENKKEIIVCDYAEWMPYIGHNKGHTFGIVYDYYKAFEKRIGIPIRFVNMPDIPACVAMVAKGHADAVVSMGTPNTFLEIALSEEFGEDFVALITRLKIPFIGNIKTLEGKKIGVVRHYKNMIAYLHQTYPALQFQMAASTKDGLDKVANGELDAFIDIYRIAAYNIQREHIGELKINTKVSPLIMRAHVGLRKEDVILKNIFNKAIASLSAEEKTRIINHWMRAKEVAKPDYRLIAEIIVAALLILLAFLYYHLRVRYHQKELLDRQAKLAGMGSMINNIAHQWRQPLSRINSNITVLKSLLDSDESQKETIRQKLDSIEENTQYMSDTIEAFMHFFAPGKPKSRCYISHCVHKALNLTGINDKDIEVTVNADKEISLYTYEEELIQVLLIILNNAVDNFKIKSAQNPKIEIQIKSTPERVILSIHDNGGGIAEKETDRIFEPYHTTKFEHEGAGLGLYMAKLLTENSMGGHLIAKNENGGAMFEIILPAGRTNE